MYLTNIKYTDFTIYNILSDRDLLSLMLSTKQLQGINDEYFKYRIIYYYGKNIVELNPCITFKQQYQDIVSFLYREYNEEKLYTRFDLLMIAKERGWYPSKQQFNKIVSLNCPKFICQVMNMFGLEICDDRQQQDCYVKFEYINTLESAIYTGNLETAKWLVEMYGLTPTNEIIYFLGEEKHLEIIRWLYKEFGKLPRIRGKMSPSVIQLIIELDNHRFRNPFPVELLPPGCATILYKNGYLILNQDTLDCLIGENANYFELLDQTDLRPSYRAIHYSVLNFNMESLSILADKYSLKYEEIINCYNLETLIFLYERYGVLPSVSTINILYYCERNLNSLKLVYEKFNILPSSGATSHYNDIPTLNWLYDKMTIPIDQNIVDKYAPKASIELLKFYYDKYQLLPSNDSLQKMKKHANFAGLNWCLKQSNPT